MITHAEFQNYKTLRDVKLGFTPRTLIIGANGAGKSSVLDAVHYLMLQGAGHDVASRQETGLADFNEVHSRGAAGALRMGVRGTSHDSGPRWGVEIEVPFDHPPVSDPTPEPATGGGLRVAARAFAYWRRLRIEGAEIGKDPSAAEAFRALIGQAVRLKLDPARLAEASYSEDDHPRMQRDGRGLAMAIRDLKDNDEAALDAIVTSARAIVPQLRSVRPNRARA